MQEISARELAASLVAYRRRADIVVDMVTPPLATSRLISRLITARKYSRPIILDFY